ncbi:hypothetical protein AARAC_010780 [Aspergillus arachidicola]|uniref:Uncharacterized protein n=1 Tax=Aspergillus arachidicola TaxID=656916 RepID=A0A2G7G6G3_9EURO|nr:hypothetical protein AARAC_010780 [Aspergillus arachidicola]
MGVRPTLSDTKPAIRGFIGKTISLPCLVPDVLLNVVNTLDTVSSIPAAVKNIRLVPHHIGQTESNSGDEQVGALDKALSERKPSNLQCPT